MRWPESRRCRRLQNAGHRRFRGGTRVRANDQWNPDSRRQDPCDDLGGGRDITRGHNEQRSPEGYIGAAQSVRAHPFRPASAHSCVANERQEVRQDSNRDEPPQPRPVQQAHNGCGQQVANTAHTYAVSSRSRLLRRRAVAKNANGPRTSAAVPLRMWSARNAARKIHLAPTTRLEISAQAPSRR